MTVTTSLGNEKLQARITSNQDLVAGLLENDASNPDSEIDPGHFAEWCQLNKLPLMTFADRLPVTFAENDEFSRALESEREWYATQRDEYVLVRDAWSQRGIPCLMIKSAGNHPTFPHTSDNIDILVQPEQGRAARDTLRELGYVEVRNVEEPQKFLFRRFHGGRCVSAIHVHEQIAWFVGFLDDALVWSRMATADDDPAVNVPSFEDAILINLAHACYENKILRLNDVVRVRHAILNSGPALDWEYMFDVASQRGWRDGLAFMLLVFAEVEGALFGRSQISSDRVACLESLIRDDTRVWKRLTEIRAAGIEDLPLDLSYVFCKRLYYRKIMADGRRSTRERLRDVGVTLIWGIKLKSRIRPQPGFIITLSGADGTGKTAHAETLVDALRLCELKADYFWSRGGSTGLLARLSSLQRRLRSGDSEHVSADPIERRQERLSHPAVGAAWAWIAVMDQLITYYRHIALPAWRGRVVVADRYVYDTAVELEASLPTDARFARLAIGVLLRCAPRANLRYLLEVSPETAGQRKPAEVWHAGIEDERRAYRVIASQCGLRLISTEGDFAVSNDRLLRDVIMEFMHGFSTRRNALFFSNPQQKNAPDPVWLEGGAR